MKRYESYKPSGISWIGEIPSHWSTPKFYQLFDFIGGKGFPVHLQGRSYGKYPFYKTSDINSNEIFIDTAANYVTDEDINYNSCNIIPEGAFIMSKIGAALRKNHRKITTRPCLIDNNLQALIKKKTNKELDLYLFYFLKFFNMAWVDNNGTIPCVDNGKLRISIFPIPPIEEQKKIVEYLSTKTSLIDAQQRERERELRLLEELKQAEIANVVTRGLNPDVPMKDSGIPWIGKIPSHWEIRKIRSLYALRTEKVSDKDFEPLSVSKQGVTPQLEDAVKTDNGDNRKLVRKGDFVVNSRSDRKGSCGVSDLDGSVSLINIVIYPITKLNPQYYHLLFRSNNYIEEFYRLGRGIVADLWTTKFDDMRNIFVPYPPIEEQRAIVEYIEQKNKAIDNMIANLRAEIDFLTEYKQRLIADAVTGQIKID